MSRLDKVTLGFAALTFVMLSVFAAHRTSLSQCISLPIFLCFLGFLGASFVRVFTRWRARRWRSLMPLAACIGAIVGGVVVGHFLHQALFAWALPSYERVVTEIQAGRIVAGESLDRIPEAESSARLAYAVFAQRQPDGTLVVEFLTEAGFPVKHSGYLYSSSGMIEKGALVDSRWPIQRKVREHWFYISD